MSMLDKRLFFDVERSEKIKSMSKKEKKYA